MLMKKGYSHSEKSEPFQGGFKTPGRLTPPDGLWSPAGLGGHKQSDLE